MTSEEYEKFISKCLAAGIMMNPPEVTKEEFEEKRKAQNGVVFVNYMALMSK